MVQEVREGLFLYEPPDEWKQRSRMMDYIHWLKAEKNLEVKGYNELWHWSVTDIEAFWESLWHYFKVIHSSPYSNVLSERKMPGALWFKGARLNYAEHIFRQRRDHETAMIAISEVRPKLKEITWKELYEKTASMVDRLKAAGVKKGDRVVGLLPNIPEAVISFLACAAMGAVWSSCSPEFGKEAIIERFQQIEPKVLLAVDGFSYKEKIFARLPLVQELQKAIPSIEKTIIIPYAAKNPDISDLKRTEVWDASEAKLLRSPVLSFAQVPFEHPLWILYTSGTTGLPKAIVQGHGGILLEHLKQCSLQMNLNEKDRFFWYTTTGWMMWNMLVSGLLTGAAIVLYDGHPGFRQPDFLWRFAEECGITYFGTSAAYLLSCMHQGLKPKEKYKLEKLSCIGSTGSPLSPEGFAWVYQQVKKDLWLSSISGGTDICSAFVGGSPLHSVHAGEIQCRHLGANVKAFDENGHEVINTVGELVVTKPLPSMPLFFWNDKDNKRYLDSYFTVYPGVWRHGDLIKIKPSGGCQIYGRSDATIKRGGIRIGTSELYRAVEALEQIEDCLAVDLIKENNHALLCLFVVTKNGVPATKTLQAEIKRRIRETCSPRHVPDFIFQIKEVPRTINGKKLEVPVKKILMGMEIKKAVNIGSIRNPESLNDFLVLRKRLPFS